MKGWNQRNPEGWELMLDMLAADERLVDIEKATGIPRSTINTRLIRYGRQSREIKDANRRPHTPTFWHDDNARIHPALMVFA